MSEEIQNAPTVVPWSILFSIVFNGVLALAMIIATLFVTVDLQSSLNSPTGYAFMDIFVQATGSVAGATMMASIITVLQLFATVGVLASCSRMSWSFARDRGLPGYKTLAKVRRCNSRRIFIFRADCLCFADQSTDIDPCRNNRCHDHDIHPSFTDSTRLIYRFQQHCIYRYCWIGGIVWSGYWTPPLATRYRQNSAFPSLRITAHEHAWF